MKLKRFNEKQRMKVLNRDSGDYVPILRNHYS